MEILSKVHNAIPDYVYQATRFWIGMSLGHITYKTLDPSEKHLDTRFDVLWFMNYLYNPFDGFVKRE